MFIESFRQIVEKKKEELNYFVVEKQLLTYRENCQEITPLFSRVRQEMILIPTKS